MIDIRHIVLGPLETNCYFLQDTETGDVLVFDPGWYEPRLEEVVRRVGAEHVKGIVLTHCHFDHMMGVSRLQKLTGAPVFLPLQEKQFPEEPALTLAYMVPGGLEPFETSGLYAEGRPLTAGSLSLRPLHTPGHTIGSHGSPHGQHVDDHAVGAPPGGAAGRLPRLPRPWPGDDHEPRAPL